MELKLSVGQTLLYKYLILPNKWDWAIFFFFFTLMEKLVFLCVCVCLRKPCVYVVSCLVVCVRITRCAV